MVRFHRPPDAISIRGSIRNRRKPDSDFDTFPVTVVPTIAIANTADSLTLRGPVSAPPEWIREFEAEADPDF